MKRSLPVAGGDGGEGRSGVGGGGGPREVAEQMTRKPGVKLNHKSLLTGVARQLDTNLCLEPTLRTPEEFMMFKEKLAAADDNKALLAVVYTDPAAATQMFKLVNSVLLTEMLDIDHGVLTDFPPTVNANFYCKIVEFAMKNCPRTLMMVTNMVVRPGHSIYPRHVLIIANQFANLGYLANRDLDASTPADEAEDLRQHGGTNQIFIRTNTICALRCQTCCTSGASGLSSWSRSWPASTQSPSSLAAQQVGS
jgi:hypothetical protein